MKVFDVFLFNGELDLLEIRLNLLSEYVDHFVITESEKTHSGIPKELYYQTNKHLFEKFNDKIIYNVVEQPSQDDLDEVIRLYNIAQYRTFQQDAYEKDSIKKVLVDICSDDDVIIWSDLDEIPNPDIIKELKTFYNPEEVYNFAQDNFQGYLNWIETTGTLTSQTRDFEYEGYPKWIGTKMCSFSILKKYTMTQMRRELHSERNVRLYPGGWHWSTVGSPDKLSYYDRILKKIKGASHVELNNEDLISTIPKRIEEDRSPIGQDNARYKTIDVNEENNFPQYIIDNKEKYSYIIKE